MTCFINFGIKLHIVSTFVSVDIKIGFYNSAVFQPSFGFCLLTTYRLQVV